MVSSSVQLIEPIPTNAGLIGSFFTGRHLPRQSSDTKQEYCQRCNELLMPQSRFCGDCGSAAPSHNMTNSQTLDAGHQLPGLSTPVANVPDFAHVSAQMRKAIPPELKKEYCKVHCLLSRERFFLVMHYLIFLGGNLFGFWMSVIAYNGLVADEVSRAVIALFPTFFINSVAFACLVPIKGTKKEIARLKERMTYLHYQIEYVNL